MIKSLVVTVIGLDRPGLVSLLSDRARGFGANWAASRMASLAGQFAGMVHFEVPAENARALADALAGLESAGLRVVIAETETKAPARDRRVVRLELVGQDRPGIMRDLSARLAERGVSIDELHTEIASAAMSAENLFKVKAALIVPEALSDEELRRSLEALANEMMVDIALGDADVASR
jgi:methionyl-tRNA formyltransferase